MRYRILVLSLILSLITSCSKLDFDEATSMGYDASLGIPICKYHASIFNILESEDSLDYIYTDLDNTLYVYWEEERQDIYFDFIEFDEGDLVSKSTSLPEMVLPQGTSYILRDTMHYRFNYDSHSSFNVKEYTIDSIVIDKANINLDIDLDGIELGKNSYIDLTYEIPDIKDYDKNRFNAVITKNHANIRRVIPRFTADFSNQSSRENIVDMVYEYKIVSDGTTTISKNATIDYSTQFNLIQYNVAYGRFWEKQTVFDTVIGVKLPKELLDLYYEDDNNRLLFHDPIITFYVAHNLGADLRYVVDSIRTLDKNGNTLEYADFGGSKSYTNNLKKATTPFEYVYDTIVINRENGNTHRLFSMQPDSMVMNCHVYVGKTDGGHNDFIVNPMNMIVDVTTHINADFDAGTSFSTTDTVDADIASVDTSFTDYARIKEFYIILRAANSLPVQATVDVIMLDENDKELYRKPSIVLDCPDVDERGVTVEPTDQRIELHFTGDEVMNILKTKKICFTVNLRGKDAESMLSIRADNAIDINVSAYGVFRIKTDNLK